jgi:hypothetical protein
MSGRVGSVGAKRRDRRDGRVEADTPGAAVDTWAAPSPRGAGADAEGGDPDEDEPEAGEAGDGQSVRCELGAGASAGERDMTGAAKGEGTAWWPQCPSPAHVQHHPTGFMTSSESLQTIWRFG